MITLQTTGVYNKLMEYAPHVLRNGIVLDKENKAQIQRACKAYSYNQVGLLLQGNPGGGKTMLMEMLYEITNPKQHQKFMKTTALDIVLDFNAEGHKVLRRWQNRHLFIDDLGVEEKGVWYGERPEVLRLFIQQRYNLFRLQGIITHFTTNLSIKEIEERYDVRSKSRLQEMCVPIVIGGDIKYTDRRTYHNFMGLPKVNHPLILTTHEEQIEAEKKIIANQYEEIKKNPPPKSPNGLGQFLKRFLGTKQE